MLNGYERGSQMSAEVRDIEVTVNDVTLSVREYGSSDKAEHTVVMLHGFCLDKDSWNIQAEALSEQWDDALRVISYDHRGHGRSKDAPMYTYTIPQLAKDLAGVLKEMNVRGPLTLTGHSMGGMTIMAYMGLPKEDRPIDPDHIVLVATSAGNLSKYGIPILLDTPVIGIIRKAARRSPEKIADFVLRNLLHPLSGVLVRAMGSFDGEGKAQATIAAASINKTPIRTKAGFLDTLRDHDVYDALDNIDGHVTVLSGGNDYLTPATHANDIVNRLSSVNKSRASRHIHFKNSGHMILHDEPRAVTAALNLGIVGSDMTLDDAIVASIIGGAIDYELDESEAS